MKNYASSQSIGMSNFRSNQPLRDLNYDMEYNSGIPVSAEKEDVYSHTRQKQSSNDEIRSLKGEIQRLCLELEDNRLAYQNLKEENQTLKKLRKLNENECLINRENFQLQTQKFQEENSRLSKLVKKLETKLSEQQTKNKELAKEHEKQRQELERVAKQSLANSQWDAKYSSQVQEESHQKSKEMKDQPRQKQGEFEESNTYMLIESSFEVDETQKDLTDLFEQSISLSNVIFMREVSSNQKLGRKADGSNG